MIIYSVYDIYAGFLYEPTLGDARRTAQQIADAEPIEVSIYKETIGPLDRKTVCAILNDKKWCKYSSVVEVVKPRKKKGV